MAPNIVQKRTKHRRAILDTIITNTPLPTTTPPPPPPTLPPPPPPLPPPPSDRDIIVATIATLAAGPRPSVPAAREHRLTVKMFAGKAYPKPCVGPPGCTKLMCDHSYVVKSEKGGYVPDSRILKGLLELCRKSGYPVSVTYATEILERENGMMVKAFATIKDEIDLRHAAIHSAGRISVAFELEQSRRYNESLRSAALTPVNPRARCMPENRDELFTCLENEDRAIKETLEISEAKAVFEKALKNSKVYKTNAQRDAAMWQYQMEARFRSARSEYYKDLVKNNALDVVEREKLMVQWDDDNTQPRIAEGWTGSPFRINQLQVVDKIENFATQHRSQAQTIPTPAHASGSNGESSRAPRQASVEDGAEPDEGQSTTTDPLEEPIEQQTSRNAKGKGKEIYENPIIAAEQTQAEIPFSYQTLDQSQALYREVLNINDRFPEHDDSIDALRLLALELIDENINLKEQNLEQSSSLAKDVIESINIPPVEDPEEDTWTLDEFLGQLSATTFETWSYEARIRGIRMINIGDLMNVIETLQAGVTKICRSLMNSDQKVLHELSEFLYEQSLTEYVRSIFEVDIDRMNDQCLDALSDALHTIYDIDLRMLIMKAFNLDSPAKYTIKDQREYDILQSKINETLVITINQFTGAAEDPEKLEEAYNSMKQDGFNSFPHWVSYGMLPVVAGDDYLDVMDDANKTLWRQISSICTAIDGAIQEKWPETLTLPVVEEVPVEDNEMIRDTVPATEEASVHDNEEVSQAPDVPQVLEDDDDDYDVEIDDEPFDYTVSFPPVYDTRGNAIFTETVKLYEKLDAINRRIGRGRLSTEKPDDASIEHVKLHTGIENKLWAEMMIKICDGSAALAVSYYERIGPMIMKYLEKSPYKANRAYCDAVGLEFGHLTIKSRLQELLPNRGGSNAGPSFTPSSSSAPPAPKQPKVVSKKAAKAAAKKAANDLKGRGR